jgi:hypothetical protein
VSRRAGCGKSARPDPWGPREGNDPGLPDHFWLDSWVWAHWVRAARDSARAVTDGCVAKASPPEEPETYEEREAVAADLANPHGLLSGDV